jgi:hypothetical protein
MTDVWVDPAYLEKLATRQDEAADEIADGVAGVEGCAENLWYDHGVVCGGTAISMQASEDERTRAGKTMELVSEALAENVRKAAANYVVTDEQADTVIDQQVLPG